MSVLKRGYTGGPGRLRCGECGAEFEPWDDVFTWDFGAGAEEPVCEDCFDGLFAELSRKERAGLIGAEVIKAEELMYGAASPADIIFTVIGSDF